MPSSAPSAIASCSTACPGRTRIRKGYAAHGRPLPGDAGRTRGRGDLLVRRHGRPTPTPRPLTEDESLRIKKSVILACRLRAGVHRDRYNRELEAVFGAEGPGRLGLALERLLAGLDVIGVERETALKIVEKVALDSVPPIRRKAYEALVGSPKKTREVATALDLPTATVRRALEDIAAHGLATRQRAKTDEGKDGRDDIWTRIEITVTAAPKREPETEKEEA